MQEPSNGLINLMGTHSYFDNAFYPYISWLVSVLKSEPNLAAWELFNEPDNKNTSSYGRHEPANKGELALMLLRKTFAWAREVNPSQPLTVGIWGDAGALENLSELTRFILENSDVISFHNYGDFSNMRREVEALKR